MKKLYRVAVVESWIQGYMVEADSPEEATKLVKEGKGKAIDDDFEFCDFLHVHEGEAAVTEMPDD